MDKPQSSARRKSTVETLGPMTKNRRFKLKSKSALLGLGLLVLTGLVVTGYEVNSDKNNDQNLTSQIATPSDNSSSVKAEVPTNNDLQAKVELKRSEIIKPIVVFEPEGIFSEEEKADLMTKLVDPMVDYQPKVFATIHIEIYSQDKFVGGAGDDKYIVTTIGRDDSGGTGGFLYGSKKKGLDYWIPECLDGCEFSEEFKLKHPEVVKKYQP